MQKSPLLGGSFLEGVLFFRSNGHDFCPDRNISPWNMISTAAPIIESINIKKQGELRKMGIF